MGFPNPASRNCDQPIGAKKGVAEWSASLVEHLYGGAFRKFLPTKTSPKGRVSGALFRGNRYIFREIKREL